MGFEKKIIKPGDGTTMPKPGQKVRVHYTATVADGTKVDSSRDRQGDGFVFVLGKGEVIKGWDEGVREMSKGEQCRLICSPDYAYGHRGYPGVIPPNATMIFEVELLDIM